MERLNQINENKQFDSLSQEHSDSKVKTTTLPPFQLRASQGIGNSYAGTDSLNLSKLSPPPFQLKANSTKSVSTFGNNPWGTSSISPPPFQIKAGNADAGTQVHKKRVDEGLTRANKDKPALGKSIPTGIGPQPQQVVQRFSDSERKIQRVTQPIVRGAPQGTMGMEAFIRLIEQEEAKYSIAEQRNTSLMISRIRKIFYGSSGWDEHLIPGAQSAQSPYGTPRQRERSRETVEIPGPLNDFDVVDIETYPVDASGQTPQIYNHQEIALEGGNHDGIFMDIGHVFAGLDAFNHRQNVTALLSIEIDNVEGTTWVGDLGSVLAESQIDMVNTGNRDAQRNIEEYAPAQDMLGNIDAYAIAASYNIGAASGGQKVSEILRHFYLGEGITTHQSHRYHHFAQGIGLTGWNGSNWANEAARIEHYTDQVNDAAAMYIGAGGRGNWLATRSFAVGMSTNSYAEVLVRAFFRSLKTAMQTETD